MLQILKKQRHGGNLVPMQKQRQKKRLNINEI